MGSFDIVVKLFIEFLEITSSKGQIDMNVAKGSYLKPSFSERGRFKQINVKTHYREMLLCNHV